MLENIIKITKTDYETLVSSGSITKGGITYTYSPDNTLYLVENGLTDDYVQLGAGGGKLLSEFLTKQEYSEKMHLFEESVYASIDAVDNKATNAQTAATNAQTAANKAYTAANNAQTTANAKTSKAFSNIIVGDTTVSADAKEDTLTLVAGSNVTLTPDATNDKITISSTNTDTHNTSKNVVTGNANSTVNNAATNGNVYLNHIETTPSGSPSITSSQKIEGIGGTNVSSDASGNITIKNHDVSYATSTTDTRGHWTVTIPGITELYDGLKINVRLSTLWYGNGESYNTLNVNGLGPQLVWYRPNERLTSHYYLQYAECTLTYWSSNCGSYTVTTTTGELVNGNTYTGGWMCEYAYYTTDTSALQIGLSRPTAASALGTHHLCAADKSGRIVSLVSPVGSYSSSNPFTPTATAFKPENIYIITGSFNSGVTISDSYLFTSRLYCYTNYNFNSNPTTAISTIYLVGTLNKTTGLFTLDQTTTGYYLYVPCNADISDLSTYFTTGKYYISIGQSYATSSTYFSKWQNNTVYYFDGSNLVPVIALADRAKTADTATALNTGTVGALDQPVYFSEGQPVACTDIATKSDITDAISTVDNSFYKQRGLYGTAIAAAIPTKTELTDTNKAIGSYCISYPGASGHLLHFKDGKGGSSRYIQMYTSYSLGMYWRQSTDASLEKDWRLFLDTTNYTSYVPTKTGSGASGTWGINISGIAAKATADKNGSDISTTYATKTELTNGLAGKANTSHTHTKSQITDFPTSMKNPSALTIKLNGTSQGAYDGSSAKEINITASSVGAATASDITTAINNLDANPEGSSSQGIKVQVKQTDGKVSGVSVSQSNTFATLDTTGKVPSSQLPSYVDDVLEYSSKSEFPTTGETGKIYVATDTNLTYRWSGSAYVEISPSLALGTTSSTAYYGDKGKTAYDHSQVTSGNPHKVTKSDVGLGNVDNTADSNKSVKYATSAGSASKLTAARSINGTSFNGTADITTSNWGTARNISISDSDGSNTGTDVSVNGSDAVTLKLPSTIKATLKGNADTATTAGTATLATTATTANSVAWSNVTGKPNSGTYIASTTKNGYEGLTTAAGSDASWIRTTESGLIPYSSSTSGSSSLGTSGWPFKTVYAKTFYGNLTGNVTGTVTGNASTATKLQTPRTISLGTAVTSTATSFSGESNITIPVNSIKESYLTWGGKNINSDLSPVGMSISAEHSANRLAFINGDALTFEYSSDGGSTWTDYGYSASTKSTWCTTYEHVPIGRPDDTTDITLDMRTRVTLAAQDGTHIYVYTNPRKLLVRVSNACGMKVLIEYKTGKSDASWVTYGEYPVSGWSGWNEIPLILGTLGGGSTQTGNNWYLRLTFIVTSLWSTYPKEGNILGIRLFGTNDWSSASINNGKGSMSSTGHLYSYDINANATFPAAITAKGLISSNGLTVTGNGVFTSTIYEGGTSSSNLLSNRYAAKSHTHAYSDLSLDCYISTIDLNTLKVSNSSDKDTTAQYYAPGGNTCANKPSGVDGFGLKVIRCADGWYTQILFASNDNRKIFQRWYNGSSWDAWTEWKLTDTTYTHPNYTAVTAAAVKVGRDNTGHVIIGSALTKSDVGLENVNNTADSDKFVKSATTATYLGSSTVGAINQPIYLDGGTPSQIAYTIQSNVPENAVFTDTHYSSKSVVTANENSNTNNAATNGNVRLNHVENSSVTSSHIIKGTGATTVTSDANGTITINSTDTNTDTKVTAVGNHYTPTKSKTTSASGGTLTDITNSSSGTNVVTGVEMDAAGHVTGVTSVALKSTNTTYSTGTASTSGLTKLYTSTGTNTDGTMTQSAINTALSGKANSSHTHDDRYYTETEVNTKLGGKVDNTSDGVSTALNKLTEGTATPSDADYYISQYAGGGTTTTTYHRRPLSALWNWIKSKLATVATSGSYTDLTNKPTSLKNPSVLAIGTSDTPIITYDGSEVKSLTIQGGGLTTVTGDATANSITISSTGADYTAGTGISISNATISNSGVTGVKGAADSVYKTGNVNLTPANIGAASSSHTHSNASTSAAGFMSAADKTNLNNLTGFIAYDDINIAADGEVATDVCDEIRDMVYAGIGCAVVVGYNSSAEEYSTKYPASISISMWTSDTEYTLNITIYFSVYCTYRVIRRDASGAYVASIHQYNFINTTSLTKGGAVNMTNGGVWSAINTPTTTASATAVTTILTSSSPHRILHTATTSIAQTYTLPASPVTNETFVFYKLFTTSTLLIKSTATNMYNIKTGSTTKVSSISYTASSSPSRCKITCIYNNSVWYIIPENLND